MIPLVNIREFKDDKIEKARLKKMLTITLNFNKSDDSDVELLKKALCQRPGSEKREDLLKEFFNVSIAGEFKMDGEVIQVPGWIGLDGKYEEEQFTKGKDKGWVMDQIFLLYALDGGCWWIRCIPKDFKDIPGFEDIPSRQPPRMP